MRLEGIKRKVGRRHCQAPGVAGRDHVLYSWGVPRPWPSRISGTSRSWAVAWMR